MNHCIVTQRIGVYLNILNQNGKYIHSNVIIFFLNIFMCDKLKLQNKL